MKKIILTLVFSFFCSTIVFAQDLESATNLYNSAATVLNEGKKAEALKLFEEALEQANILGAEAEELAYNCKSVIPIIYLSIGKEQAAAKDLASAIPTLQTAIEKGTEYGIDETVVEATALIPQLYMSEGGAKLNKKDYAGAVVEYKKVVEFNPKHAMGFLRLGMSSARTNDEATTVSALQKASELGQKKNADKELAMFYYRKAAALYKAKKFADAYTYAQKSSTVMVIPQALSIAGKAAFAQKKYKDAITSFEAYLAKSPKARDANQTMYQLATAYETLGNKAQACGYYKQIIKDPSFKEFATHKITQVLKCK